jgi:signal transduction histidine kinase
MNLPTPIPPKSDRFEWLKRLNASLSQWAATLTWWRMIALALITLIAANWIFETLALNHEKVPSIAVKRTSKAGNEQVGKAHECEGEEIRIGGQNGIVFCEGKRSAKTAKPPSVPATPGMPAVPPEPTVSGSTSNESKETKTDAPPADAERDRQIAESERAKNEEKRTARITIGGDDDDEPTTTGKVIKKTISGWIGDIFSALLVALFAYLVASKIIVRKTAEADAKLRVATDSADREAMQRQLVQARLKLLQAQVEPHFLFNTLAAVDYLIETDAKRASVMQKTLISYLRAALPQMRQESSTLGREVTLIRAYLQLLKLRIEDRLEFDIKVAPNLESAVFPPMVLQTLVENAIKHGIEPKPEGGRITVLAELIDGQLRVDVVDTGVGLPDGDIFGSSKNGSGLGLDNIRNRLALLYPGASKMELRSGHEGGTLVRLSIPYQPQTHS